MSANVLSLANAYNPGSDLWIFPELENSDWAQKVDWYINFQIIKNSQRKALPLSDEIQSVLSNTGLDLKKIVSVRPQSLMISTSTWLPNKWLVVVDGSDQLANWTQSVFQTWNRLKKPTLRVFLPTGQNASSFLDHWRELSSFQDMTLVLDSENKVRSNE